MFVLHRPVVIAAAVALAGSAGLAAAEETGLGRVATEAEIAGWDIDIRPDGQGLPDGSGSVLDGEVVYLEQCAVCHGDFGEGAGRFPVLMGGEGTLASHDPVKTVGSYWPYASTLWDYVNRAMPFGNAQSLSDDDVYAVTAYLLYLNDLVGEDFELTRDTLPEIVMPNRDGFVTEDPRPEFPADEPCMTDCTGEIEIIGRARILDVTPEVRPPSDM